MPARIAGYTVLAAVALATVLPLLYMVSLSLQSHAEANLSTPVLLPASPQWGNYVEIFKRAPLAKFAVNSVIVAGTITIAHLLLDPLIGFAFAKYRFPFRDTIFTMVLGTLMVPFFVRMIPLYVTMADLGWLNTYQGLITPFLMDAFGIFLCRQFAQSIPDDLIHSARIDGASEFALYRRIILPQLGPALAVIGLFTFVHQWNELLWPLIVASSDDMRTIPVGLSTFADQDYTLWELTAAGSVVLFIPTAVLFLFSQRYFVRGIALTGMK